MWSSSHILEYLSRNGTKKKPDFLVWCSKCTAYLQLFLFFFCSGWLPNNPFYYVLSFISILLILGSVAFCCSLELWLTTPALCCRIALSEWRREWFIFWVTAQKTNFHQSKNQTRECDTTKWYARRRLQQKGQVVFDSWLTLQVTNHRD